MGEHRMTPPLSDESHERKLVALSMREAQKLLESGNASSQIITHFLRLGSARAQIELAKLELENKLLEEKILSEQNSMRITEMMKEVLQALKSYSYVPPDNFDVNIY